MAAPLRGVFGTRSPDRPNPSGIHRVRIRAADGPLEFTVGELGAVDGTPIIDVKPALDRARERCIRRTQLIAVGSEAFFEKPHELRTRTPSSMRS